MDADGLAVVTGGSRGVGRSAAEALARLGRPVVVVGRTAETVQRTCAQLTSDGYDVDGRVCDVADPDDVRRLRDSTSSRGPVDLLVNCAGVMTDRSAKTIRATPAEWRRVMDVNLMGAVNTLREFVPEMLDRRSGRVINVSACLGRSSGPGLAGGLAPYRASKAALNAVTRSLAAETAYGRRGLLVDAMCPGHCRTDMGGPHAPRTAEQGADTIIWLATRESDGAETGRLWEERQPIPW